MPIIRDKSKKDFTIMTNHHLRNQNLSLKARGLLSTMLALPENWDFSINGLAKIVKDGISSVRAGLAELEEAGYVVRIQQKDENGKFSKAVYNIYEVPQNNKNETLSDLPVLENPTTDNQTQSNINKSDNIKIYYNQSVCQSNIKTDRLEKEYNEYKEIIKRNIEYENLITDEPDSVIINEILELMSEIVALNKVPVRIGGNYIPSEIVKKRFLSLNYSDISYVTLALSRNTTKIRNIKAYLISSLFNSKTTNSSYYTAEAMHDMYGSDRRVNCEKI